MGEITDSKKNTIESVIGKWIMRGFVAMLILLFAVLVSVIFSDNTANYSVAKEVEYRLMGKMEAIKLIGWAMSGMLAIIGIVVLNRRADAQIRAAEAQVQNNELVEKGHTQERLKTATEHLGHTNASVRIAAFYEFLHLIKDNGEEYRKSILDILYAHIRTTTADFENCKEVKEAKEKNEPIKPTEEIQGLLDILFKSNDIDHSDIKSNLQRGYFSGADLASGNLSGTDLSKANLSEADLSEADLSEANLSRADLSRANLSEADLSEACLIKANLSGVNWYRADLSGADLSNVDLSRANLSRAKLSGANLFEANLLEADLSEVNLSGANLFGANLSKAKLFRTNLIKADLSIADLSDADLSKAELEGAFYTNYTIFPKWFVPPTPPPDNGDEVQFPENFVAPEKPNDDE